MKSFLQLINNKFNLINIFKVNYEVKPQKPEIHYNKMSFFLSQYCCLDIKVENKSCSFLFALFNNTMQSTAKENSKHRKKHEKLSMRVSFFFFFWFLNKLLIFVLGDEMKRKSCFFAISAGNACRLYPNRMKSKVYSES